LVILGARRTGSSFNGRAPRLWQLGLAAARFDHFVGIPIGIIERRPVLWARRHVMSALFLLNAFFLVRFLFHGVLSVDDVERDPANFVASFIRNQNGVMPVLQFWPFLKESFGKSFRSIHCRDVVRQFRSAFINDRFGIDKIEVIEWHYFSRHTRLNLCRLDLLIAKRPARLISLNPVLGDCHLSFSVDDVQNNRTRSREFLT
jgi:hypothetical protein